MWRRWRDELARHGVPTPTLDAKLLVGHGLGYDVLQLMLHERDLVSISLAESLAQTLKRRVSGESVARIMGQREFYGLAFDLSAATLEPRPDTELVVDLALAALPDGGAVLDLGTGSGCIPISILSNRPDAQGVATDINPGALEVAERNAERHGVLGRLTLKQGDWFGALRGSASEEERFHLILSNPPYISSAVVETLSAEVKDFDPRLALDGGPDGLAPYRIIAAEAGSWLRPGGEVMVEIGYDQSEAVAALFAAAGFAKVMVHKDLSGLDRVVSAHHMEGAKA
nr:peptide chain release factor N(5)-glutamine methyltransferase [Devosia crocina]